MQVVNILGFCIAMFLIAAHYATKVADWLNKRHYEKYRNNSSEFVADMYRLKMKWAKRGEFMYCKAIDSVIGAEMMQDEEPATAQTEYGRDYLEKMKSLLEEEARRNAKELE